MNTRDHIAKCLAKAHMMQLATVKNSQPWCCTVYFVHDDDLNLYWFSKPTTRHSSEIATHAQVAAAIPIAFAKDTPVVGVQVEGAAEQIEGAAAEEPARLYAAKFNRTEQWVQDCVAGKTTHKLYCLRPQHFAVFDEQDFPKHTYLEWYIGDK